MGEMVERVARSLARSEAMVRGLPPSDDGWEYWQFAARGVLGALREPTGGMKDAGAETYGLGNSVIGPAGAALVGQPTKAYQAMIDKALED